MLLHLRVVPTYIIVRISCTLLPTSSYARFLSSAFPHTFLSSSPPFGPTFVPACRTEPTSPQHYLNAKKFIELFSPAAHGAAAPADASGQAKTDTHCTELRTRNRHCFVREAALERAGARGLEEKPRCDGEGEDGKD